MKYNLADQIPHWLNKLKPGHYTTGEVADATGTSKSNVYMRFESLEVTKIRELRGAHWKNVYEWKGAKYYFFRIHENRAKKLMKEICE